MKLLKRCASFIDIRGFSRIRVIVIGIAIVAVSAATLPMLEVEESTIQASTVKTDVFNFEHLRKNAPRLRVQSAMLVDFATGEVLYAKNQDSVRSIASITKLVSAMVVLESGIDMTRRQKLTKEDVYRSSRSRFRAGDEMTLNDLLHASLMASDNRCTRALARAVSGSVEAFVLKMNEKMKQLGLDQTIFNDPTGLDPLNVSTAKEIAVIVNRAYRFEEIARITSKKQVAVHLLNKRKRAFRTITNTNVLVASKYRVLTGKTGFISEAQHCLTTILMDSKGHKLTLVVLGAPGSGTRFREAKKLADWGFREMS
jgi:serine-type D-Ala-D-Ala endopeptidase (penicillin-binding protein 7)